MEPLVTIGMPVFNGARYLRGALDSLLLQTHSNLRLIISDNASTDETAGICCEYEKLDSRVTYRRNEVNIGAAANFRLVSELAEGGYFMFAAHDDLWDPSYIGCCLAELRKNPDAILCSSDIVYIGEMGDRLRVGSVTNFDTVGMSTPERVHEALAKMNCSGVYGVMKLEALRATNIFPGVYGGDVILMLELALLGEFARVPAPLFFDRVANRTKTSVEYLRDINPKDDSTAERPFTFLASELWETVRSSELDAETKDRIRADFIRVLTYKADADTNWRRRILAENGKRPNLRLDRVRDLVDGMLAPVETETGTQASDLKQPPVRQVLVFSPSNPLKTQGSDDRSLDLVTGLVELGCEVVLASTTDTWGKGWDLENMDRLYRMGVADIELYNYNLVDRAYRIAVKVLHRLAGRRPSRFSSLNTPPGMRLWFTRIARRLSPDTIVVMDDRFDGLVHSYSAGDSTTAVVAGASGTVSSKVRAEGAQSEPAVFGRYDRAVVIPPEDARLAARSFAATKIVEISIAQRPEYLVNGYEGPAVCPTSTGPNPMDLKGYEFFADEVLPLIRAEVPDFSLVVTGACCHSLAPVKGVELLGPDHEKRPLYERCAFAVFPQVALAGHQAAAVEAMANGLAIVTSTDGPANSFIDHGVNGYLAASPDEFARYSRMLWEDRDLCRQLGSAARDTIAAESSHERLLIGLSELLR